MLSAALMVKLSVGFLHLLLLLLVAEVAAVLTVAAIQRTLQTGSETAVPVSESAELPTTRPTKEKLQTCV